MVVEVGIEVGVVMGMVVLVWLVGTGVIVVVVVALC